MVDPSRLAMRWVTNQATHRFAAGTISWNFITPVVREFCLMHGMCDVRRDTMVELLSTPGRAVMVAIGGASEALLAAPGTMNLILNKRYGPYPLCHHRYVSPVQHAYATSTTSVLSGHVFSSACAGMHQVQLNIEYVNSGSTCLLLHDHVWQSTVLPCPAAYVLQSM